MVINDWLVLLTPILTVVISGAVSVLLFRLQTKRDKKEKDVNIIAELERICGGLTEQLLDAHVQIMDLRAGVALLLKQLVQAGLTPIWHPDGKRKEEK